MRWIRLSAKKMSPDKNSGHADRKNPLEKMLAVSFCLLGAAALFYLAYKMAQTIIPFTGQLLAGSTSARRSEMPIWIRWASGLGDFISGIGCGIVNVTCFDISSVNLFALLYEAVLILVRLAFGITIVAFSFIIGRMITLLPFALTLAVALGGVYLLMIAYAFVLNFQRFPHSMTK